MNLGLSGAVVVGMHFTELNELLIPYHHFKLIAADKEVVLSMYFTHTRLASCETYTEPEFIQVLGFDSLNESAFSSPAWANNNKRLVQLCMVFQEFLVIA